MNVSGRLVAATLLVLAVLSTVDATRVRVRHLTTAFARADPAAAKPKAAAKPAGDAKQAAAAKAPAAPAKPGAAPADGAAGKDQALAGMTAGPDPLSLGAAPPGLSGADGSNTLPPYAMLHSDSITSPPLGNMRVQGLNLDIDKRIKQAEDLLNRMVWQLNRETSWANSVHDIIQNYQYKYTKVLSNIKKHSASTKKMRDLLTSLKKARLHEILEQDLEKATNELTELASSSSETSEDEGSYASLKDRVALMKQDLEKMSHQKVNKVLHSAQDGIKDVEKAAVPPPSSDTLKGLGLGKGKEAAEDG